MNSIPSLFYWSGGKDSCLALHHVLQQQHFDIRYLLTTLSEAHDRVSMHGVRQRLLLQQAESLGLPLYQVKLPDMPDMFTYESTINSHLNSLKAEGITHAIFGDLFLEDLRIYREKQLAALGMNAEFPLWNRNTTEVLQEFLALGYKTVIVCAQHGLEDFCGRIIDEQLMNDLPKGVDPCGENGEFHTFVFDGPIFKKPIDFILGEKVYRTFPSPTGEAEQGYWYVDLIERQS